MSLMPYGPFVECQRTRRRRDLHRESWHEVSFFSHAFLRRNVLLRGAPLNSIWASTCPPYLKSMWAQMEMQMLYVGQYMTDGARRYGGCWGHDMCNRSTWAKVSEKLCFGFCSRINLEFKFTLAVGGGQLEGIVWMNSQCGVLNLPSKWFKLT